MKSASTVLTGGYTCTLIASNSCYTWKDSQKIKIKKKTKTPRITDEGWNSQKQLSDPVEKMKEGRKDSCIFIQSSLQV